MNLYFDNNATTPVAPEVLEAMLPFLREDYGNASSIHRFGQRTRAAVERARGQLADLIHAEPSEIVFTSGGTESDNLAVQGAVRVSSLPRKHIITSAIEHPAVLYTCRALEKEGVTVTYLPVSSQGVMDPNDVRRALRPETVLITIMHANNEIGTVQPIGEVAAIAKEAGVLCHTDAVQSTGKIPLDVRGLGVDLLTLSAHKFYGPKGIGALYIRKDVALQPVLFGGHNEHDPRPGTDNVAAIVGIGAAARLAGDILPQESRRLSDLRDDLESGILRKVEDAGVNGARAGMLDGRFVRVPNTTNMYFDHIEGESLVIALDLQGLSCSTGAACSSGALEPSHVLTAIGLPAQRARSSVRLSLGVQTTKEQVNVLLETLPRVVERLRALSRKPWSVSATVKPFMNCREILTNVENLPNTAPSSAGKTTVVIAMSGGVDSSTAAAILASGDYQVIGLTMQLWDQRRLAVMDPAAPKAVEGRCCSLNDVYDARRVAEHLDFPFYVVNFERNFEQAVIKPFVSEYMAGRTPIPCTLCNNHVKFDQLLMTARQIGADFLATGHYARVEFDPERGRYLLRKAVDETKDQSYFLFGLTQEQLSRTLFPLGSFPKQQVRELATRYKLPVADKPESQEICFVPGGDYAKFLDAYQREQGKPIPELDGEIATSDGRVLGRHNGLHHFTVGQRKGLGVATGTPLYVISLDPASRKVVVGHEEAPFANGCMLRDVNWISQAEAEPGLRAGVKIRHQHIPAPATISPEGNSVRVRFDKPQRAVTPGQAAVFYQGDLVVGGGWIERVEQ